LALRKVNLRYGNARPQHPLRNCTTAIADFSAGNDGWLFGKLWTLEHTGAKIFVALISMARSGGNSDG
jgi:hypothetical protein